jgi:hypothetical protein
VFWFIPFGKTRQTASNMCQNCVQIIGGKLACPAAILASSAWFAVGIRIIVGNEKGQDMQKRKLGQLEVTALGMGCMGLSFGL